MTNSEQQEINELRSEIDELQRVAHVETMMNIIDQIHKVINDTIDQFFLERGQDEHENIEQ